MVPFTFALALAVSFGSAFAQSNPLLNGTLPPAQPAAPTAVKPQLSPESLGDVYMVRKMYREAIESFREASQKDPVVINKIGIAYHQLGELEKAKKSYEQAVKLKPDYGEAHNNLGAIYYSQKSYRKAVNTYKKALRYSPDSASIHMNLSIAYFARKNFKDAALESQKALELDPEVFERRGAYGTLLQERNVEERAQFNYYMAKLYAKNSRVDLALQYLRKALENGFKDKKKISQEPEFKGLLEMPEFKELLALEPRVL
jgi:tetratricopeptide (TPR) repeat protein